MDVIYPELALLKRIKAFYVFVLFQLSYITSFLYMQEKMHRKGVFSSVRELKGKLHSIKPKCHGLKTKLNMIGF